MSADRKKINKIIEELSEIIELAQAKDVQGYIGDAFDNLLKNIAKPYKSKESKTIYEYLLKNKKGLELIARMRRSIVSNYSPKGKLLGKTENVFVSPHEMQWIDEGVLFLQGPRPFEGILGLYNDEDLSFAVVGRDIRKGDSVSNEDLVFVKLDEIEKQISGNKARKPKNALEELESMLKSGIKDESKYHNYFKKYPWIFGGQYVRIDSHKILDDENIPDFTGVRVKDKCRDIIEIKQPFLKLSKGKKLNAIFNDAFNQAERYLDFAERQHSYLYDKGLLFENPQCYLIIGYNLNEQELRLIRNKERRNPGIRIYTYNDILKLTAGIDKLIQGWKE